MTSPLRVLDLTDELAHQGARLLVGLGADVVRLHTPGSDRSPADRVHWHAGKRLWEVDDVRAGVRALLPAADVVVESGPFDALRTLALRAADPAGWAHVVHVVVTPFGLTGPRRHWLADDPVLSAAGGMAWLGGDPGEAPEPPPRRQASQIAGAHAAIAALLGLHARRRTGEGQLADVSAQEAVAATLETGAIAWIHAGTVPGRTSGVYGHVAHRVFEAADGHVAGGYSGSNRMWDDLLAWLVEVGEAEDLADERWRDPVTRWRGRPHVDDVVARFVRRRGARELAEEARRRALPWAAVTAPADLVANPQLRARRFFTTVDAPGDPVVDVGFPFASPGLPRPVRLSAPDAQPGNPAWRDATPRALPAATTRPLRGALDGVRVLDLTWVLAGPYVTRTLADHGATIIKIESRHRQDPTRFAPGMRLRPGASPDDSGYFLNFNRDKQSVALNLRSAQGPELLRRLVREVDVVVENFSPGVLARWGLAYERMREINPGVVLVSMAGVGQDGPWRDAVTFADTLAAMSGLTSETGRADRAPQGLTFGLGDVVAANAAVLATLERLLIGGGGHVDLSQLEAMAAQLGTAVLDAGPATGGRVLRTRGDDRWIAIGGAPADRLDAAMDGRRPEREDADELAAHLQRSGIPAHPVRDGRDLVESDEQLRARGFYVPLDHPLAGTVLHEGVVVRLDRTPGGLRHAAPLLGQHTDEVLSRLLGLAPDDLADLHAQGVLE